MIEILNWIAIFSGGILVLLFLISLIGGLELDVEMGSTDVETDAGGIGLIKGLLSFLSVGSWVMKVTMVMSSNPLMSLIVGILSGIGAFLFLNYLFKLLLKNESNVNWTMEDALFQSGEVYLKIPADEGSGIVTVMVNSVGRELKAKSLKDEELETGARIIVVKIEEEFVIVERQND